MSVCGTGLGNFPQPGDPDMDSGTLSAVAVYGGVQLTWGLPALLTEAVSHTNIYFNTVNSFGSSTLLAVATGNNHFHRNGALTIGTAYYYWIKMVSVNGTVGATIGPASATMDTNINDLVAELNGEISDSYLSTALKARIDTVDTLSTLLSSESSNRLAADSLLSGLIATTQADMDAVDTALVSEIATRISQDTAIVDQVDAIIVTSNDNAAAIITEATARANADTAIAGTVTTLTATVGTNTSAISTSALAIAAVEDDIVDISAEYMVKLDVNGYVTGFGLTNNGSSSSFLVHTDNFAIGEPGETGVYPFIVSNVDGVPVIALNGLAMIPDAAITNAKIQGTITSSSWNPSTHQGWSIDKAGNIEGSSITLYDTGGSVILSSGSSAADILNSSQTWAGISGAGKPADNANYITNTNQISDGANLGGTANWSSVVDTGGKPANYATVNTGAFATLSGKVTAANISTYINGAAIDTAYIANAAITTALIDSLAVSTIKIADNAVTIPESDAEDNSATLSTSWVTVCTHTATIDSDVDVTHVSAFANYQNTVNTATVYDIAMRILVNGASVGGQVAQTHGNITSVINTMAAFTGLSGSTTFAIQLMKGNAAGTYLGRHAGMLIQGVKK